MAKGNERVHRPRPWLLPLIIVVAVVVVVGAIVYSIATGINFF